VDARRYARPAASLAVLFFALVATPALPAPPARAAEPAGVPRAVLADALARSEGPLYVVEGYPRVGIPSVPGVEVLGEWEGGAIVCGPADAIELLPVLGYEIRRVSPARVAAPPSAPVSAPVEYDPRVQALLDEVEAADLMTMLNGLTGETPVTIGGSSEVLDTRYSSAADCRQAEQFAFETFQAAGLDVAYESYFGGTLYGIYAAPGGLEGWTVGTSGTVLHTSDGGAAWSAQPLGVATECWGIHSPAPDTLWIVGNSGMIRKSVNGGASWASQTSGTGNYLHGVFFRNTREGWVVGDYGTIRRTVNGGTNWTAQTSGTPSRLYAVQFVGPDSGWACGRSGTIVRTLNQGASWTRITGVPTTERLYDLSFPDRMNGWAVGWNGTIVHTSDGGATWSPQSSPTGNYLYAVDFTSATEGWIAGWNGTILHTTDGGANWIEQDSGTFADFYSLEFSDALHGWAAGAGVVARTDDGGATWVAQTSVLPGSWRNVVATKAGVSQPERQILLTAHLDDTSGNPTVDAPGADDNGSGSVCVLRSAQIIASLPFEKTLRFVCFTGEEQGLVGSGVYASDAAARGDLIDAVVNLDMIAYESNNIDIAEVHAGTDPASAAIAAVFSDVNATYALGFTLQTLTTGATTASDHASFWDVGYPAILGIEDFEDFTPYYHTVNDRVGTLDQSYFTRFTQASLGTAAILAGPLWTVDAPAPTAPPRLALQPASPSPSPGRTAIRFALGAVSPVRVEIFDVAGRLVRSIDAGLRGPGDAAIAWDGRDAAGRDVPSSVLLYRVTAGRESATGRLTLIR